MDITLDEVRRILRRTLGYDSYIAGFVRSVRASPEIPTAAIARDGTLHYNPSFVEEWGRDEASLFCLLFHEVLHPLFGHFLRRGGELEDLAADAIINALISNVYGKASGNGVLFRSFYAARGITGLLRPESDMQHSRYGRLYEHLYSRRLALGDRMTTGEFLQMLKALTPSSPGRKVLLLGSHGRGDEETHELSGEVRSRFALEIEARMPERPTGYGAGFSESLVEWFVEAIRTQKTLKQVVLKRFLTQRKVDRFFESYVSRRRAVSPIPLSPSKRDLVLWAAGHTPLYFHYQAATNRREQRGLAIYLDVSGSVSEHLPELLGLLRPLRQQIESVFTFSNRVVEVPFQRLIEGHIPTTVGTDFDCVARSLLERGFRSAVIATDGYASLNDELAEDLRQRRVHLLTVLFGGARTGSDLEPFGEVVRLEDITQ